MRGAVFNQVLSLTATGFLAAACASGFKDPGPALTHAPGAYPRFDASKPPQQCVPFARNHSGVRIFGDAGTWWAQAADRFERDDEPEPGAVIVVRGYHDPKRGHVAVVRKVLDERQITVDHANWLNKGEVQLDTPVMDISDGNDWSKVRVWNLPGRHFGGRIYEVLGFIRPVEASAFGPQVENFPQVVDHFDALRTPEFVLEARKSAES
jgi:hypothetical protein